MNWAETPADMTNQSESISSVCMTIGGDGCNGSSASGSLTNPLETNSRLLNERKSNISYMASGDRVRFGPVECVFHLPESARADAQPVQTGFNWRGSLIAFAVVLALLLAGMMLIG